MKLIVGAAVVLVVILIIWQMSLQPHMGIISENQTADDALKVNDVDEPEAVFTPAQAPGSILADTIINQEADGSAVVLPARNDSQKPELAVTPRSVESAMDSMREGLISGDSRTPPLTEPVELTQPSLEELNDPVKYQRYEQRQVMSRAGAYFSAAAKELPELRAKIAQARQSGSQSEEDIQQAEEALQRLELLQLEYQLQLQNAPIDSVQSEYQDSLAP